MTWVSLYPNRPFDLLIEPACKTKIDSHKSGSYAFEYSRKEGMIYERSNSIH